MCLQSIKDNFQTNKNPFTVPVQEHTSFSCSLPMPVQGYDCLIFGLRYNSSWDSDFYSAFAIWQLSKSLRFFFFWGGGDAQLVCASWLDTKGTSKSYCYKHEVWTLWNILTALFSFGFLKHVTGIPRSQILGSKHKFLGSWLP